MTAVALLLVVILICVTTFACIQVTHAHNRRMIKMRHQHELEKDNHRQMIENEKRNRQ